MDWVRSHSVYFYHCRISNSYSRYHICNAARAPVMITAQSVPNPVPPGTFITTHITGDVGTLIGIGEFLNSDKLLHPFSKDIWELSKFSHAAICDGKGNVIEAEPGGARLHPLSEYTDGRPLMFSNVKVPLNPVTGLQIVDFAMGMLGTPYSSLDYFADAAKRFHIPLFGLVKKRLQSNKSIICSQLVTLAYTMANRPLIHDKMAWEVTPLDLAKLIA